MRSIASVRCVGRWSSRVIHPTRRKNSLAFPDSIAEEEIAKACKIKCTAVAMAPSDEMTCLVESRIGCLHPDGIKEFAAHEIAHAFFSTADGIADQSREKITCPAIVVPLSVGFGEIGQRRCKTSHVIFSLAKEHGDDVRLLRGVVPNRPAAEVFSLTKAKAILHSQHLVNGDSLTLIAPGPLGCRNWILEIEFPLADQNSH